MPTDIHNTTVAADKGNTSEFGSNTPANDADPSSPGNAGPMYSPQHAVARSLIAEGRKIFPCRPGAKQPHGLHAPNGFKDATDDLATAETWFADPDDQPNIAACPEDWGLCVIDADGVEGLANWRTYCAEQGIDPDAGHVVMTPHGRHLYYAGSLPPTASKIAPHVDTRGCSSYVVLPSSVVDGAEYSSAPIPQPWDLPEIPECVVAACAAHKTAPVTEKVEFQPDTPAKLAKARRHIDKMIAEGNVPVEGNRDTLCFETGAWLRDYGLSWEAAYDEMCRLCEAGDYPDDDHSLADILNSVYGGNAQNAPGSKTAEASFGKFAKTFGSSQPTTETVQQSGPLDDDLSAWTAHDPRDPADMPELAFFDADRMIPMSPDGAVGILYGKRGDHKTNTLLSMLDRCNAKRILYAAGEGAYGVERDRLSARPGLDGRVKVLARVPLFSSPEQVEKFIAANDGFRPEIVVLDTLATVLAGEDEQSSTTASYLTDNGPAGIIKRAWNCTVILIAHAGKDVSKGVRGSSGFEGNVDFVILVSADKPNCAIRLKCEKMRDGYDQHESFWRYEPAGVPVPVRVGETEYRKTVGTPEDKEAGDREAMVRHILHREKAYGHDNSIPPDRMQRLLTEYRCGPCPGSLGDIEYAHWQDEHDASYQILKNGKKRKWAKEWFVKKRRAGGTDPVPGWCLPESEWPVDNPPMADAEDSPNL